jgi:hypothetical protein
VSARRVLELLGGGHERGARWSRSMADCIARALDPEPAARFPSAVAFGAELARARSLMADRAPSWRLRAATVVAVAAAVAVPMIRERARDEAPAEHPVAVVLSERAVLGDAWRDSLIVALREWRDVMVAVDTSDGRVQRLRLAVAANGAVTGMLHGSNGRPIGAVALDAPDGRPSLEAARRVVSLALRGTEQAPFAPGTRPGSESLAAWRAYDAALERFGRGALDTAEALLRGALGADAGHRGAMVRLGLLGLWSPTPPAPRRPPSCCTRPRAGTARSFPATRSGAPDGWPSPEATGRRRARRSTR